MVEWQPGETVPAQLGDAFAALYDWFEPRHAVDADNNVWNQELPDSVPYRLLRRSVEQAGAKTPDPVQRCINNALSGIGEMDVAHAVYFSLCAIDRGTKHQSPSGPDMSRVGAQLSLLNHYLSNHRFNTDASDGYVLPKWTGHRFRGSTSSFEDHFVNLVRAKVDRGHVRLLGRSGSGSRRRNRGNIDNPSIVIVPTLYEFSGQGASGEAFFKDVELRGQPYFTVEHDTSSFANLRARVQGSVRAIHESRATIAVYPELVLNQELLKALGESLLLESQHKDNRRSNLDWIIVGAGVPTEPGASWPVVNTCHVLNRYGRIVATPLGSGEVLPWVQKKRYRYKLSRDEQQRYGVVDCFPDFVDREEAIQRGQELYVFEDRGRRFAVLICEDLAEERDTVELARKMLCSVLVTIVMDGPVHKNRWHGTRSSEFAVRTGSLTVVANSLLLPNLKKVREDQIKSGRAEPYPNNNKPVGLMFIPVPGSDPIVQQIEARATPIINDIKSLISEPQEIPLLRSDLL